MRLKNEACASCRDKKLQNLREEGKALREKYKNLEEKPPEIRKRLDRIYSETYDIIDHRAKPPKTLEKYVIAEVFRGADDKFVCGIKCLGRCKVCGFKFEFFHFEDIEQKGDQK